MNLAEALIGLGRLQEALATTASRCSCNLTIRSCSRECRKSPRPPPQKNKGADLAVEPPLSLKELGIYELQEFEINCLIPNSSNS